MKDPLRSSKEICEILSISNSTLRRLMKREDSNFPKPVKISRNYYKWKESEIYAWRDAGGAAV